MREKNNQNKTEQAKFIERKTIGNYCIVEQ